MTEQSTIQNILFIDIETVPQFQKYAEVPSLFKLLWEKKCHNLISDEQTIDFLYRRAGIYAEFGKIICISCGYFTAENNFRIKSFFGHEEKNILQAFSEMLNKSSVPSQRFLCAHNGKEFDFPFICRRLLINGMRLPAILNIQGKKPWETSLLDTMEMWKFGDYKSYTSLNLLAAVFEIPTPKDDIDGSMVWQVYWENNELDRIVTYCQKDVLTIGRLYRKFRGEDTIQDHEVEIVDGG